MENYITLPEEHGLETEKYESTNIITRVMIKRFYRAINELLRSIGSQDVLEVGCGEGFSAQHVEANYEGIDIDPLYVEEAKKRNPGKNIHWGDIYKLTPTKKTVLCLEVLEHLERPAKALAELHRIADEYVIVSVPSEPLWHVLNLLRGKYLKDWGNGPGHINHWTPWGFKRFCASLFDVVEVKLPLPWTILLLKKRHE